LENVEGRLEGWDPLLTTEAKYGLFALLNTTNPPQYNSTVVKTTQHRGNPNTAD